MSRAVNLRESLTDFRRAGWGVSHSRKVVPDVSIIISAQHTHTHPQPPRPGMPALCTPALSAQPRPETRRETVVIPTCLLRKPPSPWPLGAGGGTWSGKRRRERIIPGQRRLTVFGAQSSGRIFRKAGQLWCGTLSQLEADENESFQGRVKKKQKKHSHDPQIPPFAVAFLAC